MFVEKHDILGHLAWAPATDTVLAPIWVREAARYRFVRAQHTVSILATLAFCVLLLATAGDALPSLWPALLLFALLWPASVLTILHAHAWRRHIETTGFDATPCLCFHKDAKPVPGRGSRRKGNMTYHVTIQYAPDSLTALQIDEATYYAIFPENPALLLRMQYKNRTYYDIIPKP